MAEKTKKDWWDKLQVLSILLIPLAVAYVGNAYSERLKESENRVRYLELAISILRDNPKPETNALREWGIELLDAQSKTIAPLSAKAKQELREYKVWDYDISDYGSIGDAGDVGGGDVISLSPVVGPGCCSGAKRSAREKK